MKILNELVVAAIALAGAASVVACNPLLTAESPAPPGRTARLDDVNGFWGQVKSYTLEISQGTAVALSCYQAGPCTKVSVISDDPTLVDVRPASLAELRPNGWHGNAATASELVIIGKSAGTTTLHLHSAQGTREIAVTVVAQPTRAEPKPKTASIP